MSFKKKATFSLNYNLAFVQLPWKTMFPSLPILTNFPPNSSNPKPPNISTSKKNDVKFVKNTKYFYTKKDGDFHYNKT